MTGQHAVLRSELARRLPATALPIEVAGAGRKPSRREVAGWYWYLLAGVLAVLLAWWAGGR